MKIKGTITKGKDRGRPIEFSPEEKFSLAVKDAVKGKAPKDEVWWAEDIEVPKKHWVAKKAPDAKRSLKDPNFANNGYSGSGTCFVRRHELKTDKLRPRKKVKFKLEFCDCLDDLGLPDLKIEKFKLDDVRV
jgi:hypothetical protein